MLIVKESKMEKYMVLESPESKEIKSLNYKYHFNKINGLFARWGRTKNDDPAMAPGPEIADIEITTSCYGVGGRLCPFCFIPFCFICFSIWYVYLTGRWVLLRKQFWQENDLTGFYLFRFC